MASGPADQEGGERREPGNLAELPRVRVFCDGGCKPNPGRGGWAAILRCDAPVLEKELSGGEPQTTNNRMELTAVVRALEALKRPCRVVVTTDSEYVANAFRQGWLASWKRRGWRLASKKPVLNQDLWRTLDELVSRHQVKWEWVAGHSGHPENERCDELATRAREREGREA
jgi:ribonuclease HI